MSHADCNRLNRELLLLAEVRRRWGIETARIARQITEDFERPLPDVFPPRPEWTSFTWPESGEVNLEGWWWKRDRGLV